MQARSLFTNAEGSLIAGYASRLAGVETVRRAEREARAARAEAEITIKARGEFLASMNHELRTPLNAIIGFGTMLRDAQTFNLTAEQSRSYAEYILQSADLLLGHLSTILEAASIDGGQVLPEHSVIDLRALLEDAVSRGLIAAGAGKVTIETRSAEGPISVWGDRVRLAQALDHVLRVAVRASPPGSAILARAVPGEHGWGEIAVRDRSPGLSQDALDQALNAFKEPHHGFDRPFAGPGIGLAIAKAFVELQGGRFTVRSRVGEGTLVRLSLPPGQTAAADDPLRKTA